MKTMMTPTPGGTPANPQAALLDVKAVAALLDCSPRHVARLADTGALPLPVKVGRLTRWRAADLQAWITDGCRPVRNSRGVR